MTQLRHDYQQFVERGAEVVLLGPDDQNAFKRLWQQEEMPFVGLADVKSVVGDRYDQEVSIWKLGRMPAVLVIDREGYIRYRHYGNSMSDIPENLEVLAVMDALNRELND